MRADCLSCGQGFLLDQRDYLQNSKCRVCSNGLLEVVYLFEGEVGYSGLTTGKGSTKKDITGWNPGEKTFYEYCGKKSYENDHEILDKVYNRSTRDEKKTIDEIKSR